MSTTLPTQASQSLTTGEVVAMSAASVVSVRFQTLGSAASLPRIGNQPCVFRLDQPVIITIDGPAGTGKSSVARALAKKLGLDFLDTGAMYRAAAAIAIDNNIATKNGLSIERATELVDVVQSADLHFDWTRDPPEILAWNRSIEARIRDGDVTSVVSAIAGIAALREHMVRKQRIIGEQHPRLVTEGRDQGSVVFPKAKVKFYLTASPDERARRRAQQLTDAGKPANFQALREEIIGRDRSDMSRAVGPLMRPEDALEIDTSSLTFDQVVSGLEKVVRDKATEPD